MKRRPSGAAAATFLAAWSIVLMGAPQVAAQSVPDDSLLAPIQPVTLIPTTKTNRVGFTATIAAGRIQVAGSVPVKIVVRSTSTFTADRQLVFRFTSDPLGQSPPSNGLRVDVPVELSQGTRMTSVTRYLPKWSVGLDYRVTVREQGQVLAGCEASVSGPAVRNSQVITTKWLDAEYEFNWVLVLDSERVDVAKLPDIRALLHVRRDTFFVNETRAPREELTYWKLLLESEAFRGAFSVAGQSELPTDWRGYQALDVIILSQASLQATKRNGRYSAIRDWVLAGGSIVLYDADSLQTFVDSLQLVSEPSEWIASAKREVINDRIRQIKGLRTDVARQRSELSKYIANDPNMDPTIAFGLYTGMSAPNQPNDRSPEEQIAWLDAQLAKLTEILNRTGKQWDESMWVRPLGTGFAIGFPSSDSAPFPGVMQWKIVDQLLDFRSSPMLRRGADPILGDNRFRRWMIPGVAQPPVYTFIGLLTLFVILVGPVAYRSTSRRGRSYLMFLIAPVLAIVTTVAMFAYGIVADGFDTIARVRQLTWIDGATGDASERVQATYFAGVRPADGMTFPASAEVVRYPDGLSGDWEDLNKRPPETLGTVTITNEAQVFDKAFLPSRQQRQFVTHRPRAAVGSLQLTLEAADTDVQVGFVRNDSIYELRRLVVRGNDGKYWTSERVAAGSSRTPVYPLASKDASEAIAKMYNEFRAIGEDSRRRSSRSYRKSTRDLIKVVNEGLSSQTRSTSFVNEGSFEQWLGRALQIEGQLPHSHFVAMSDVTQDAVAVESARVVDSVHYVFGTLP
ncbi:hypothetical protein [Novipirellula artificiosorum]|uniref:DUF4350 domain-containing protein n=1 Tax=Novipirellula artificiosorum TaxID=2528016 RepID=A0A5C6DQQ8_9BACT|nr:hypothetical protein [Novipirellula artificiosorum]TWU39170.1 hypothetical protein Poly41_19920 [Novipirellula artificiosorum]